MSDLLRLQKILGREFKSLDLLKEALTHKSFASENALPYDNQRLEFLGDSVVQIALTQHLFRLYPGCHEGELTKMRSAIAKESSLAAIAKELSLGEFLMLGKGELESGGSNRDSTLSDAFESLLGAVYLDAGLEEAQQLLIDLVVRIYPEPSALLARLNPKGALQEFTQQKLGATPDYSTVEISGPDHSPSYTVEVFVGGHLLGKGSAPKRKAAESAAAEMALSKLIADEQEKAQNGVGQRQIQSEEEK